MAVAYHHTIDARSAANARHIIKVNDASNVCYCVVSDVDAIKYCFRYHTVHKAQTS